MLRIRVVDGLINEFPQSRNRGRVISEVFRKLSVAMCFARISGFKLSRGFAWIISVSAPFDDLMYGLIGTGLLLDLALTSCCRNCGRDRLAMLNVAEALSTLM